MEHIKNLTNISGSSEYTLLKGTIDVFWGAGEEEDPTQDFVDDFNDKTNPSTPLVKSSDP